MLIQAERVFLRQVHLGDLAAFSRLFADPLVMEPGQGVQTPQWTRRWIEGCLQDYHVKWGFGLWAAVLTSSNTVMGFCGLTRFEDIEGQPEIELGYRLMPEHWGRGLATEAARAATAYAFGTLGIPHLIALIERSNVRSLAVAAKCGFHYQREVRFQNRDVGLHRRSRQP